MSFSTGSQRFPDFMINPFRSTLSSDVERCLCASLVFLFFSTAQFVVRKQIFQRILQCLKFVDFEKCWVARCCNGERYCISKRREQEISAEGADEEKGWPGDGTPGRVARALYLDDIPRDFGPEVAFSLSTLNLPIPGFSDMHASRLASRQAGREAGREGNVGPQTRSDKALPYCLAVESISPPYGPYVHKHW